jgi:hypothetical protein
MISFNDRERVVLSHKLKMDNRLKTYFYQVSGLNLESEIPLPDLIKTESAADVKIRYGEITDSRLKNSLENARFFERPGCQIRVSAGKMLIEWEKVGKFLIRDGGEVIVEPERNALEEDLQPFLTGPVLSVLLHQRGSLVLHASAVVINRAAVVFLGAKGYGKSTLAAHLQVRGHQLLSDDIVPVSFTGNRAQTVPGYPRIKLFEDSITAIGANSANLPLIHRFVEKRSFQCAENFSTEPIFLRGVYVLAENEQVFLEPLRLSDAFIEVTKNTYLNRYLEALNCLPEHFRQCQKLIQGVPVFKLYRPHNFELMDQVCSTLENHIQDLVGEAEIYRTA